MSEPLIIAVPSKGRLKEQVEAWLGDCGLELQTAGGARGYLASLKGLEGAQVRLLSAGDIADALAAGEVHTGVTGEDLLHEKGNDIAARVLLLQALGFGQADLVVAVPKSWLDVESMADLEEVSHDVLYRTGRRLQVATKYLAQTRAFFARHGVADYRITESAGATEGAPAAGSAELVVDITTTGATLAANGLKVLDDGVILRSQAHLAASLKASWSPGVLEIAERLLRAVEARAAALTSATLTWPERGDATEARVVEKLIAQGALQHPGGLLVEVGAVTQTARTLTASGLGPVIAARPDFIYEVECPSFMSLRTRVL